MPANRTRKVRLTGYSKLARGDIRVTVDRQVGLVLFRVHRKHTSYDLPLDTWVGLGFDYAVKAHALAVKQARREARRQGKESK